MANTTESGLLAAFDSEIQSVYEYDKARDAAAKYEIKKEKAALLQRQKSWQGRNIAPIPPVKNPERRANAIESLEFFARTYFSETFSKPCSSAHKLLIQKLEEVIRGDGGQNLQAVCMPRGWGKTSWCRAACVWAILRGSRKFLVLISANASMARKLMKNLQNMLESPLLIEDFPEALYPIACLNHTPSKAPGQHIDGANTNISLKSGEIVFPTVEGSPSSGAVVVCAGLDTGGLRGLQYVVPSTGATLRPDIFLADDVQTKATAKSPEQCAYREELLSSDVMYMGGERGIVGLAAITVIRKDDVADHLCDHKKYPAWNGIRCHYFESLPKNMELWEKWWDIKKTGDDKAAKDFYLENQTAMDEGCIAVWPEMFEAKYVSAIEQGMTKYFDNRAAFQSEYQSEPLTLEETEAIHFDADSIAAKIVRNRKRGLVPDDTDVLTAFVDVQQRLLYWAVAGFKQSNFTGSLIDYGTFPKQKRLFFKAAEAKYTLRQRYPGSGEDGAILAGIKDLLDELLETEYKRDDGTVCRIRRVFVDSGNWTNVVYQACRTCKYPALVMPSKGRGIGAKQIPMTEYKQRATGDRIGFHWYIGAATKRSLRFIQIDTNYWKSHLMSSLATHLGDSGSFSLFDAPDKHHLLISHLLSEKAKQVEVNGRKVDEWQQVAAHPENHWLDCLVGLFCAASLEGCSTIGVQRRRVIMQPIDYETHYLSDGAAQIAEVQQAIRKVQEDDEYQTLYPFG